MDISREDGKKNAFKKQQDFLSWPERIDYHKL
jgi:hypothetical protein